MFYTLHIHIRRCVFIHRVHLVGQVIQVQILKTSLKQLLPSRCAGSFPGMSHALIYLAQCHSAHPIKEDYTNPPPLGPLLSSPKISSAIVCRINSPSNPQHVCITNNSRVN
jgi:hypothetical protein